MSMPPVYRALARMEFDEAADWYEQQRAGLGLKFTRAVRRVLDSIAASPLRYPAVHGDVREAPVSGFPYCVYYRAEATQIVVLSVFHASRDPSTWMSRT